MDNQIAHGATKIQGSLALPGFSANVTIHHQIWKQAFPIHSKTIDDIGYIEKIQTPIHTNTHPI